MICVLFENIHNASVPFVLISCVVLHGRAVSPIRVSRITTMAPKLGEMGKASMSSRSQQEFSRSPSTSSSDLEIVEDEITNMSAAKRQDIRARRRVLDLAVGTTKAGGSSGEQLPPHIMDMVALHHPCLSANARLCER